jgi:(R,R)-butanediol dehydrogenase/meso-butanediol dehydrogenase/diacetyl reductase
MRVAVFNGAGRPITIERVPDPRPARDEVLVRVGRCGVCGSDLALTSGSPFDYALGCRLGHEYAGEVVELGAAVAGFRPGDRVACLPQAGCGACEACRAGRPIMCAQVRFVSGGFGDYVAVPAANAVRLPQGLSLADGALVEPMACGLRALRLAGLRAGERVLALGAGSMAIAIVYWARRLGAGRIVAASRSGHGR